MKTTIGTAWQAFTDGENNAIMSHEGRVLLYIGDAEPTPADSGIMFNNEKIEVGAPAMSWIRSADNRPVDAVIFTY